MPRPNILVCMCDEMRPFELGCYGSGVVKTPHIDGLAREGVRFEVAVSNCPVSMPARSAALAGQYARTATGLLTNTTLHPREGGWIMPQYPSDGRPHLKDRTLPEVLREAGYTTHLIGKWHVESWPDDVGFDDWVIPRVHHAHTAQIFLEKGGREFSPPGFSVDWEAERVRDFLLGRGGERPFFLFYNISPPHMPLDDMPEKYKTMYRPGDVFVRPNVDLSRPTARQDWEFPTYLWDYRYYRDHLPYTRALPPGFDLRALTALYCGSVTWVDDAVGRMLAALDEAGLARDTIVVFTSDHGDNLGSFQRMGKGTLNEESIRIPFIMRRPGELGACAPAAQVASLVDLAPTLLDLAGLDAPPHMQGESLAPVARGERARLGRDWAVVETMGHGACVRTPTKVLGFPWAGSQNELGPEPSIHHDLAKDPFELAPLAGTDPPLESALRSWLRETPWIRA